MATFSIKGALARSARFVISWLENSPDNKWAEMTFAENKAEDDALNDKVAEVAAADAHTKALKIELKDMLKARMKNCNYIAHDVEGDRAFGPDSALYGGFGYIRESEKQHRGGRRPANPGGQP
jgi:hypothetical protein